MLFFYIIKCLNVLQWLIWRVVCFLCVKENYFLYCEFIFWINYLFLGHGTFVENVRIEPLTPVFLDFDGAFHFGASTRKYAIRQNLKRSDSFNKEEDSFDNVTLPTDEPELDVLYFFFLLNNFI